jgi:WD40 repeat protein
MRKRNTLALMLLGALLASCCKEEKPKTKTRRQLAIEADNFPYRAWALQMPEQVRICAPGKRGAVMMKRNTLVLAGMLVCALLAGGCQKQEPKSEWPKVDRSGQFPMPSSRGPHKHRTSVAFSPDGKYLLFGYSVVRGVDGYRSREPLPYLSLIDMANGQILHSWLQEEDSVEVIEVEFLPDSRRAIVTMRDGTTQFLDLVARKVLWRKTLGLRALSPDGARLFTQEGEAGVKVWDVSGETPVLVLNAPGKTIDGETLRIQPRGALYDNRRILSWTANAESMRKYTDIKGALKYFIWDLDKGGVSRLDLPDCSLHGRSPGGNYLLFRMDQTEPWVEKEDFRLWDAKAGKLITPTKDKWRWPIFTMGRKLEVGPGGGLWADYVRFWDLVTGRESRPPCKKIGGVISPDGKWALGGVNEYFYAHHTLWDLDKGEKIWSFQDQQNY